MIDIIVMLYYDLLNLILTIMPSTILDLCHLKILYKQQNISFPRLFLELHLTYNILVWYDYLLNKTRSNYINLVSIYYFRVMSLEN